MTLFAPIALLALAVPVAIYAIHWLFGARRRVRVPALFLWQNLPRAATGRAKRHVPPFSLLLLLQVVAATVGALALARPGLPADPPRHVSLILDGSASMQSSDVAPTRFSAARQSALARLNNLAPSDLVSVIRAGKDATLLASGSPGDVRSALVAARPGVSAPAIREAIALASTRIAQTPDRQGQIILFTDGAWPAPDLIGPLAAPVEIVPTGGGSNNQSVTRLVVNMNPNGLGQTAFVEVANDSANAVHVPVRLSADGAPLDERQVDIGPRATVQLSVRLPSDARRVTAELLGNDALSLDDRLDTVAPGGPPRDVNLLGRVSPDLHRAIESIPWVHIRTTEAPAPPDLTVLAGVLPPQLPAGPLLLVDPPADSARFLGVGLGSGARVDPSHPLLQGLDLAALQDATPSISTVPGWAHVVLGTRDGPLIMEGKLEGHPVVSLTFDPTLSGMEKSLAYPLLVSNATSFLVSATDAAAAGTPTHAFDVRESDITPRPLPTFESSAPTNPIRPGTFEAWPWLAAAVLGVLGLEWLAFARRG